MRPIIGIVPLVYEKKDSLWMLPGYMDGIKEAGGIPLIIDMRAVYLLRWLCYSRSKRNGRGRKTEK